MIYKIYTCKKEAYKPNKQWYNDDADVDKQNIWNSLWLSSVKKEI